MLSNCHHNSIIHCARIPSLILFNSEHVCAINSIKSAVIFDPKKEISSSFQFLKIFLVSQVSEYLKVSCLKFLVYWYTVDTELLNNLHVLTTFNINTLKIQMCVEQFPRPHLAFNFTQVLIHFKTHMGCTVRCGLISNSCHHMFNGCCWGTR